MYWIIPWFSKGIPWYYFIWWIIPWYVLNHTLIFKRYTVILSISCAESYFDFQKVCCHKCFQIIHFCGSTILFHTLVYSGDCAPHQGGMNMIQSLRLALWNSMCVHGKARSVACSVYSTRQSTDSSGFRAIVIVNILYVVSSCHYSIEK